MKNDDLEWKIYDLGCRLGFEIGRLEAIQSIGLKDAPLHKILSYLAESIEGLEKIKAALTDKEIVYVETSELAQNEEDNLKALKETR